MINATPELNLHLHDASRFPLVRLRRRAMQPGYAFAWRADMQRLIALEVPFVIVSEHAGDETADDARLRAAWFRHAPPALAMQCRGVIVIEPRIEARATTREAVRCVMQKSGVRNVVVSSLRVAAELAPVLLKHSAPKETPSRSLDLDILLAR